MKFTHFSILLLIMFLLGIRVSDSHAQSLAKRLSQQGYLQLSGLPYYLGDIKGENSSITGYHVQLAVGIKFKDNWGLGLGSGSWGIRDNGYRTTRYTVLGPHIRYTDDRWLAHLEAGAMIGYRFMCNEVNVIEDFSLTQPFNSPFIRAQYGIRFLNRWIVGLSASYLPAIKAEGIRQTRGASGNYEPSFISKKTSIWGGQVFVGILLESKKRAED